MVIITEEQNVVSTLLSNLCYQPKKTLYIVYNHTKNSSISAKNAADTRVLHFM